MKHFFAWLIRIGWLKLRTGSIVTTFAFPNQEICIGKFATGEIENERGYIPTYYEGVPKSFSGMITRLDVKTYSAGRTLLNDAKN